MSEKINFFWFRRDLRLHDNTGLFQALRSGGKLVPVFIFDRNILDDLEDSDDARVTFIHREISSMKESLRELGSDMLVKYGYPKQIWAELLGKYNAGAIYANRDYEPYARERDRGVRELAAQKGVDFLEYKDQVIFDRSDVLKDNGEPYVVFTPYRGKWLGKLEEVPDDKASRDGAGSGYLQSWNCSRYYGNFSTDISSDLPLLMDMGFETSSREFPPRLIDDDRIEDYDKTRDLPALEEGTSRLGIHYRFGTVSIREKVRWAKKLNETYLNELIWREFFFCILDHFPRVVDEPFYRKYRFIEWRNDESEFDAWKEGRTGYPLVDAGMRQLSHTGFMHNRARMVVASFLCKHLLIDWRWGEAWFARKLLDYELSSNNGNWQWAAGCGTDAAPYFRIFNPQRQQQRFDKEFKYIQRWVPEYGTDDYPGRIVEHKFARERCLKTYKKALEEADKKGID